jgi:hypothetical protein
MKINKLIKSEMKREYFFAKGKVSLDTKYFINKIEQGIQEKSNKNYQTNLISSMTSYQYFINDKNFIKVLLPMFDLIDATDFKECSRYKLQDAWGFKQSFSDYTVKHQHSPAFLSGAIALNKHSQSLYFDDIKETLEFEPGNFVIFSGFLMHGNKRNTTNKSRYGLSFNFYHRQVG